ncbi:MAG TPA: hypothetical protein VFM33_10055 [Aquabacterium sp.]|nr:hypothetical protein [Aquabacterium sp.]
MIYTTLNRIREHFPRAEGWKKLLTHIGKTQADDEPLSFVTILDINGLDDALWCCRAEPEQSSMWRHFAVDCAESVRHLMKDQRSLDALDVARLHANGQATDEELVAAWAATWDVTKAEATRGAAWNAAWDAAWDAARGAAWGAAWGAADLAANAAANAAAWDVTKAEATRGAARGAAWDAMAQRFRYLVTVGVWSPVEAAQQKGGAA